MTSLGLPLTLLMALALAGCDTVTKPSEYTSTAFTLVDATFPPDAGVTELTPSTITFRPDGSISVASCNTCDGSYAWDGNDLRIDGLGCTEIACGSRLDLGEWLVADRIVASDANDGTSEVTLAVERDGRLATFLFAVADLD